MAIKTKQEIMDQVKNIIGDNTEDTTLEFLGDLSDTLDKDAESEDWKKKYEENDAMWKKKYRDRFFEGSDHEDFRNEDEEVKKYSFENLFKKGD